MNRLPRTLLSFALAATAVFASGAPTTQAAPPRTAISLPPCNTFMPFNDTTCWMVTKGATESNICYTAKTLGSHKVYSGTANFTFTTAESFSTTVSADLGLSWGPLTVNVGASLTSQQTTGFAVTVTNIRAGQTAKIYSRANRTRYSIQPFVKIFDTWYPAKALTQGTVVAPIRGSFCSFVYNS